MFTGIVKEIGKISRISKSGNSAKFYIKCDKVKDSIELGDSVAINGVCLSVVDIGKELAFDAVGNTLLKTNLSRLKTGDLVNMENAVKVGDSLDGHYVTGHIDCESKMMASKIDRKGWLLDIQISNEAKKNIVPKGSIAIDGISLTVAEIHNSFIRIYLIPHTLDNTILKRKRCGDFVNIEFDIMGKYSSKGSDNKGSITQQKLLEAGFL
jgi:riboflavin synthase